MDTHQEERDELAEDEEKLQLALQEVANENEWYDYDEEDEDEPLLIDLEAPSDITGQSSNSGYFESGSRAHFMTIEDESQDRATPILTLPSVETTGSSTAEKTLALNRALQGILESRIDAIQAALEINKEKQDRLNEGTWDDLKSKKAGKGRTFGPFRSPYFHSGDASSFPNDNEDTIMKRKTNELLYNSMPDHLSYNSHTKRCLIQAIVQDTREMLMKPVMNRLEAEIKKATTLRLSADEKGDDIQVMKDRLKSLKQIQSDLMGRKHIDQDAVEECEEEIVDIKKELKVEEAEYNKILQPKLEQDGKVAEIEDELSCIRDEKDDLILARVDSSKVDWMKISKLWFKEGTNWVDCEKAWKFIANPMINVAPWRKDEESNLLRLVEMHQTRDWESIAQQLNTGRTPFHCFYHYQNRFNPEFKSRAWKKEEDVKLIEAVKRVRESYPVFTWGKVSALVNSRSSVECSMRYGHIGEDRRSGRWSNMEDARLIMAVDTLGPNWQKVAKFMGTRTVTQCRERYNQCLNPDLNFFHFSYEEDKKLLSLYKEHSNAWVKIATHLKGRTDSMVKGRFNTLTKWRKEMEWWNRQDDTTKNLLLGRNLTVQERKQFEGQWKAFYNFKLGVVDNDYKKQEYDKQCGIDPDIIPPRPPLHLKYTKFQKGFSQKKKTTWSNRLTLHQRLLDNLKKRFQTKSSAEEMSEEGNSKTVAFRKRLKKNLLKDDNFTGEERELQEVIESAVEETDGVEKKIPAQEMSQVMSALNLHFLGESNIKVSELLKTTQSKKVTKVRVAQQHRKNINLRLKKVLARNKWIYLTGRRYGRPVLPVDNRPVKEIENESREWGKGVPSLLMKRLGGDIQTLRKSVQEKIDKAMEEKRKMPCVDENVGYQAKIASLNREIEEINSFSYLTNDRKEKFASRIRRKMAIVKRNYAKNFTLEQERLKGIIEAGEKDAVLIESIEKNMVDEDNNKGKSLSSSSQLSATNFLAESEKMLGSLSSSDTQDKEPHVTYSSLNYLPPTLSTISGLRSLLLHRKQLMKKAGKLYNPAHYKRKRRHHLHIILESDEEENEGKVKQRKMERSAAVKAIEVVDGDDDDDDDDGHAKLTDSWFKDENQTIDAETGIDKELEKMGNLPSTSFAPYGRNKKQIHVSNFPNAMKQMNKTSDSGRFVDTTEVQTDMVAKRYLDESSSYEVLVAPMANNVKKMLQINPGIQPVKSVHEMNSGQRTTNFEKDYSNQLNLGLAVEESKNSNNQPSTSITSHSKPATQSMSKVNSDKSEDFNKDFSDRLISEGISRRMGKSSNQSWNCMMQQQNPILVEDEDSSHSDILKGRSMSTLVSGTSEMLSAPTSSRDSQRFEAEEKEKVLQTIKGLKRHATSDDLKNVVVVGLSRQRNEIVHYKAEEFKNPQEMELQEMVLQAENNYGNLKKSESETVVLDDAEVGNDMTKTWAASVEHGQKWNLNQQPKKDTYVYSIAPLQTHAKHSKDADRYDDVRISSNSNNTAALPNAFHNVSRLIEKARGQEDANKTVVVAVDPKSGKVVHFKDADRKPLPPPASRIPDPLPSQTPFLPRLDEMTEEEIKALMVRVRRTDEYQRLLARFRALFMWPVLISTTPPRSEVDLVKVRQTSTSSPLPSSSSLPSSSVTMGNQTATIKKKKKRGRPTKEEVRARNENTKKDKIIKHKAKKNNRKDYSAILPKSDRPKRQVKRLYSNLSLIDKKEILYTRVMGDKELPQWWKNAVLEVMLKKKAIAEGKDENIEMDLSQDEDFVDKGNYSDDEWLVELREEERRKEEREREEEEKRIEEERMEEEERTDETEKEEGMGDEDDDEEERGGRGQSDWKSEKNNEDEESITSEKNKIDEEGDNDDGTDEAVEIDQPE